VGVIGLVGVPAILLDMRAGRFDREGVVDIPFFWATAHAVWLVASTVSLGLLFLSHRRHEWRQSPGNGR
jgi:hypothetical protein